MEQIKWTVIYKANNLVEAEVIKGNIENAGIPCVVFNKQDSSYLSFGAIEIRVPEEQVGEAMRILNEQKNETE